LYEKRIARIKRLSRTTNERSWKDSEKTLLMIGERKVLIPVKYSGNIVILLEAFAV